MAETVDGAGTGTPEHGSAGHGPNGAARPPQRIAIAGVVPWGVAAGALAWGLAGAWRAAHTDDYPWNAWTPIGYGAAKGVLFGALAGWCAALALRLTAAPKRRPAAPERRPVAPMAVGALLGGLAPGSIRDFLGTPQPRTLYYYDQPRPDAEWYGTPLLAEWLTYTVLPALVCVLLLTAGARFSARRARPKSLNWPLLALTGAGLLLLPVVVSGGAPAPQGNGGHVNESAGAVFVVWGVAFGVLTAALVSWARRGRPAPHPADDGPRPAWPV
ncbi:MULTISPECIES: hypothetical protein [Kitasatospora]|uniref:Uncharacterized protein n=1 Tax=Kitasatospora setae (strain ATCC 33774 / DSM 43861 / JCM 3304 / KCC A-0304 / NBRC 14216 / KM-6054) TaxID=452652 RepID=E4N369_KITSK|nr:MULTISPECIES: hypothetical protein [Kitasatospora]BAJ32603.1 hypothetical protein KSE_68450 [Kitasatospora setae KM-6054]